MLKQQKQQQRVRLALVAVLGFVGCAPSLFGASVVINPCVVASLATYTAEGFACTLDNHTLLGFTFSASGANNPGTPAPTLVSASQITVDPTATTPTDISVQFLAPEGGFSVAAGQTAEYIFHWNEDQFADIGGASMDLFDAPGTASLTGEFCGDGTITSAPLTTVVCSGSATTGIFPRSAFLQIPPNPNGGPPSFTFPTLVGSLDSRLILDLTGPASITSLGVHTTVSGTPEPSTLFFLTPALLALAWLRKKLPAA